MRDDFVPRDAEDPGAEREATPREAADVVDDLEEDFLGHIFGIFTAAQAGSDVAINPGQVKLVEECQGFTLARFRRVDDFMFVELGCEFLDRESRHQFPLGLRRDRALSDTPPWRG